MPENLPSEPDVLWKKPLAAPCPAGIAATNQFVIVADRDAADVSDVFRCLRATDGSEVWSLRYAAPGNLDYGNAPRATPLIAEDKVYLYGAFGHLHCVELESGQVAWKKDLRLEFAAHDERPWGFSSSPLIVDGRLHLNPGGPEASLVALAASSGKVLWQSPGRPAAFGSFIVGRFGGRRQIVGYDKGSLGGWDADTGRRLWQLVPPHPHDFNVPTPVAYSGKLIVSTENNGTRLYGFNSDGTIVDQPIAENPALAPDAHTPIVVGRRLFGVSGALYCLDLEDGLRERWKASDPAFEEYASLVGVPGRALLLSRQGELILFDTESDQFRLLGRLSLCKDDSGVYAHPAIVGNRLYVRTSTDLLCVRLGADGAAR